MKSELTTAVAAVDSNYRYAYDFGDIGNRETSSERGTNFVYTANQLNQYTMVGRVVPNAPHEEFVPQFDDDGDQTLIKTATGIWQVTYNGENRPVLWQCVSTNFLTPNSLAPSLISMPYDRMGRRVTKNAQRFVYDGYLQIANIEHQTSNIKLQTFVWDPTEPIATRPLVWNSSTSQPFNHSTSYYTHDGNKNVSEVVGVDGSVSAHYEYTPFGVVAVQQGESSSVNPWRFSSEFAEDDTATVYYNYRHYGPVMGRWLSRDTVRLRDNNLYLICENSVFSFYDRLGLVPEIVEHEPGEAPPGGWSNDINAAETHFRPSKFVINFTNCQDGKVKIKPSFGEIRIDIYFRTIADVVQSREDEFDHVKCYISFRNAVYIIMGVLNLLPCVCPDEASKIAQNAIEMYDHAVRKCDECNKKFDGPGGAHRHHEN